MPAMIPTGDHHRRWHNAAPNPLLRRGLCQFETVAPMAPIPRGEAPALAFRRCPRTLENIRFTDHRSTEATVEAWLAASETDGYLLLRGDDLLVERYAHGFGAEGRHATLSISKSVTGALAELLFQQGVLRPATPVTALLPELAASAYRDVTVAQLWHMTSGVAFDAETTRPASDVLRLAAAIGWRPVPTPDTPRTLRGFLRTLQRRAAPPGQRFAYNDADTEVLAWALERAAGCSFPALLGREIWQRIGAERDARIAVDAEGVAVASAGLSVALRDLGRFARWWLASVGKIPEDAAAPPPAMPSAVPSVRGFQRQTWRFSQGLGMLGNNGQSVVILPDSGLIAVKFSAIPNDRPGIIAREHERAYRAARAMAGLS